MIALLLGAEEAMAGQLMIDDFGLKEVAAQEGWVYAGAVAKVLAKDKLELTVRRVYLVPGKDAPEAREGSTITIEIYQGIKWTNPRKSPIDRRLRGAIAARSLKVGDETIAVPASGAGFELLTASPRNLEKLEVLFHGAESYTKKEEAKLAEDLADPDLADLAFAALKQRGAIKPSYLLGADFHLLVAYWESADERTRKEFLHALPKNKPTAERVLDMVERKLALAPLAELAPFLEHLEGRQLGDMYLAMLIAAGTEEPKLTPGQFSPLDRFLIRYEKTRPDYKSSDEDLEKLLPYFDPPALGRLAVGFLSAVHDSTHAGKELDMFLLGTSAELARHADPAPLFEAAARVNPLCSTTTSTREQIMQYLLELAIAAFPRAGDRAKKLAEPLLAHRIPVERDILQKYRALAGPEPKHTPAPFTVELTAGAFAFSPDGVRIAFDRQLGLELYSRIDDGRGDQLEEAGSWYLEGYEAPYLYTAEGLSKTPPKIRVKLVPSAKELAAISEVRARELAKKAAEAAGCPEVQDYLAEPWRGKYELISTGPKDKKCRVLVGMFSEKVIHVEAAP